MSEPSPRPSNWSDAQRVIREERLQLIARVLAFQREYQMLYGRDPSAEDVAHAIDGP